MVFGKHYFKKLFNTQMVNPMSVSIFLFYLLLAVPLFLMLATAAFSRVEHFSVSQLWQIFKIFSFIAFFSSLLASFFIFFEINHFDWPGIFKLSRVSLLLACLVQFLGTIIGIFSSLYLEGEKGQKSYIGSLSIVLFSVHLLLMADHWCLLILAWILVGISLENLLCFYQERPFALLAAHKKRIADRAADLMLFSAAGVAWFQVGSGSLSALWFYINQHGLTMPLQFSAIFLVLAVIFRTALLPFHGWLIQVMEAPTPVSALLHAGVVNLGGFVLMRFQPMLEKGVPARLLLFVFGLATALLAGMVVLTRISIKVRLAWSTVAQMGFMLLECALGLYTLAFIHLIGHSFYKANAFLSSSMIVRDTKLERFRSSSLPLFFSFLIAPVLSILIVFFTVFLGLRLLDHSSWPWWWSLFLGFSWAPFLWIYGAPGNLRGLVYQFLSGVFIVLALTLILIIMHFIPLGLTDSPHKILGLIAMLGMSGLYFFQVLIKILPEKISGWRRWSYAGFYVDEIYTRFALGFWSSNCGLKASNFIKNNIFKVKNWMSYSWKN